MYFTLHLSKYSILTHSVHSHVLPVMLSLFFQIGTFWTSNKVTIIRMRKKDSETVKKQLIFSVFLGTALAKYRLLEYASLSKTSFWKVLYIAQVSSRCFPSSFGKLQLYQKWFAQGYQGCETRDLNRYTLFFKRTQYHCYILNEIIYCQ